MNRSWQSPENRAAPGRSVCADLWPFPITRADIFSAQTAVSDLYLRLGLAIGEI
ncbi:hypothetical protein GCM10009796_20670 [Microbacterium koreense]